MTCQKSLWLLRKSCSFSVFLATWIMVLGCELPVGVLASVMSFLLWLVTVATSNDSEKDPPRNRGEASQVSQHHPPEDKARGALVSLPWLHSPWPRDPAQRGGLHWGRADPDWQRARWVWRDREIFLPKTLFVKCLCTSTSAEGDSYFLCFNLIHSMTNMEEQNLEMVRAGLQVGLFLVPVSPGVFLGLLLVFIVLWGPWRLSVDESHERWFLLHSIIIYEWIHKVSIGSNDISALG